MNLFQNPNTYRNQQRYPNSSGQNPEDAQNSPFPDHTGIQGGPCRSCGETRNGSGPDNAGGQNWTDNPALAGIDPARLQMLSSLASQAQGKNQNELLPFLMAAASQTGANGMSFRPDEIETIIQVLKIGKSPQEIQQIDRICSLMRQFGAMRGMNRRR